MNIITQKQVQLTSKLVKSNDSIQLPVSELILKVREQLLIVLAHHKTKEIVSQGLLLLRYDTSFEWIDTDGSEVFADPTARFKQLIRTGLDVCLACPSSDRVWHEYDLAPCEYEPDRVIIPVEPCSFVLGGCN
jgi:hypothetical protein